MVAIKDMEMPKNCNECPYSCDYCVLTGEWVSDTEQIRDKNCPLVEIVTCKDCKHKRGGGCRNFSHIINDDFYCADAERRE